MGFLDHGERAVAAGMRAGSGRGAIAGGPATGARVVSTTGIANVAFNGNFPQILGNHVSSICIKFSASFIRIWAKTSLTRERRFQSRLLACKWMR
jgi:hypothetical protein